MKMLTHSGAKVIHEMQCRARDKQFQNSIACFVNSQQTGKDEFCTKDKNIYLKSISAAL